jgi:membrane protein DedA with SNARE-associated domain
MTDPLALLALHVHPHLHGVKVGYLGIALAAAISWAGVSGPGEAVLIGAGITASRGKADVGTVIAFAWLGATLGGTLGWLAGRHGGRRLFLAGRRLRAQRERMLEHGNRFFERFGWLAVYFAPSWAAGLNGMPAARFVPANVVCSLVWALFLGMGSYLLGPSIRDVAADIGTFGAPLMIVLAVATVLLAGRQMRRRRSAAARGGDGATASRDPSEDQSAGRAG